MEYKWIDECALKLPGARKDFKEEWGAFRFLIGDKMFAMQGGDKNEEPIITLKLEPMKGEALRQAYEDVIPGYYMNKVHWNSFYLKGEVPRQIIEESIKESYELIFSGLTKKAQVAILDESGE